MLKIFALLTLVSAPFCCAGWDSFDAENLRVEPPFAVSADAAYSEPQSLRLALDGSRVTAALPVAPLKVEGARVGVAFNYHTTPEAGPVVLQMVFGEGEGAATLQRMLAPAAAGWERFEEVVEVPEGASATQLSLRLKSPARKEGAAIFFDNVRLENLKNAADFQQEEFHLDSFDAWEKGSFAHERLLFGEGGKHFFDWQRSKFGESCAELTGNGKLFQYPLKIRSLKVSPGDSYTFSFYYDASADYRTNSASVMAFFYDAEGKRMEGTGRFPLRKTDDWREAVFDFVAPEGAASVDLSFRLAEVPAGVQLYVNRIAFAKTAPKVFLESTIDADRHLLHGRVSAIMAPKEATIAARLENAKGETVATPGIDGEGAFSIDLGKLPDEEFELVAEMSWPGGASRDVREFTNYNERPWKNDLGILKPEEAPPSPWKSLVYDAERREVVTWGPRLVFSDRLGLEQVVLASSSEKLLKSPVRLLVNGSDLFTESVAETPLEASPSPNRVILVRKLRGDGYVVTVQVRTEFDGMVKTTCRIEATRDLTLEAVDLHYTPALTENLICSAGGWIHHHVMNLEKKKVFGSKRFFPMVWSGTLEAGLYVCAEALYPRVEVQEEECQRFAHDGEFTTKFINRPVTLKKGESHLVEYAVGATPMRPPTVDDPQWRFRAGEKSTAELRWHQSKLDPFMGYPEAPDQPEVLDQWLAQYGDKVRTFTYQIPFFAMTNLPQYPYFEAEWRTEPGMVYTAKNTGYAADLRAVNIARRSWQDLYLQAFESYFSRYRFDGVYYDCVGFSLEKEPDGTVGYDLFATRDYLQRIYVLQHQLNPRTWSFMHVGATVCNFNTIFGDVMLTGEHYRGLARNHRYYLEFLTLEEFRIQNCVEFGPLRMFLPQFPKDRATDPDVTTHTLGMVLLHNLYLYPNFVNKEITSACRDRYYAFYDAGEGNRFVPYWKEGGPKTGNAAVACSAYENSRGALRIYLNTTPQPQTIRLDAAATVFDPVHGQTATLRAGDEMSLEPYLMKMVLLAPPEVWSAVP